MPRRWYSLWLSVPLLLSLMLLLALPTAAGPAPQGPPTSLQAMFAAAAHEFGVPDTVLLAVGYNQSRWEHHAGQPSAGGGYGLMHLTDGSYAVEDAKGTGETASGRLAPSGKAATLDDAARRLGQSPDALKSDPYQNIRGAAALLAQYGRDSGASTSDLASWYDAVARLSGSPNPAVAHAFADDVYATIQQGVSRTTSSGDTVTLTATPAARSVQGKAAEATADQPPTTATTPECPPDVVCHFIPAAYQINTPGDPSDYGNYDLADREANGLDIRYIVIHDTETSYQEAIDIFANPLTYVSAHYVIRASDGDITQMVRTKDVGYQAGNWYINTHSIGIEHEGHAREGAAWYSEAMYRASARLVRYLAARYGIPLDRGHIIGHDDIPGISAASQRGMHWDPGPYWDWEHYMELLDAPIVNIRDLRTRSILTIRPNFAPNEAPVRGCDPAPCQTLARQDVNYVLLYTAPSLSAPLITDPAKTGVDADLIENWGNKAVAGQQFWRVESRGDWDAVFYGGQKAWLFNPRLSPRAVPSAGMVVTPKAGKASIPVYGTAYPDPAEWPAGIPVRARNPLQYTIPAGQAYVVVDKVVSDAYHAPLFTLDPSDHLVVKGVSQFYQIYFGHRFAFVKADDVDVVYVR